MTDVLQNDVFSIPKMAIFVHKFINFLYKIL